MPLELAGKPAEIFAPSHVGLVACALDVAAGVGDEQQDCHEGVVLGLVAGTQGLQSADGIALGLRRLVGRGRTAGRLTLMFGVSAADEAQGE